MTKVQVSADGGVVSYVFKERSDAIAFAKASCNMLGFIKASLYPSVSNGLLWSGVAEEEYKP